MISYDSKNDINIMYNSAKRKITKLQKKPSNTELLLLYGLFKQSEFGDNNTSQPWLTIDIKNLSKWKAWKEQQGKNEQISKKEYIDLVNVLVKKYN